MTPDQWRQVERMYHAALAAAPEARAAFLSDACEGDTALRREVESLLAQVAGSGLLDRSLAHGMIPHTTCLPGTRIGPFQVEALLGAGGMGEVYRARDTRLGREVAIKILAPVFTRDPERLSRFEREARLLASLNHPNIATLHGIEESDGTPALVMELVEGETLQERLERQRNRDRGLDPADVFAIAGQIVEALEAAHQKGVIHRDLKPANIKITPDGVVKVLDFGLAKLAPTLDASSSETGTSPPLTLDGTQGGVILGTAAYMSPEQARGQPVDRRTDIWAFGCVLYEMLTGHRAFEGDGVADVLSRVLQSDPDWTRVPSTTPAPIRRLLRLCLEKDPKKRRQSVGDVRIDLHDAATEPEVVVGRHSRRERSVWLAVTVVLLATLGMLAAVHLAERPRLKWRLQIATPATQHPLEFALSPDGRYIVFIASVSAADSRQALYLRPLDAPDAQLIPGTDGARDPFWSPDSRSVGFFASEQLERIDIDGGPVQVLAPTPNPQGGTWGSDGTILFAPNTVSPLMRVPASGGTAATAVSRLDAPHHQGHRRPSFLPGSRRFLFYVQGEPDAAGIYLGSLDGGPPTRVTASDAAAAFFAPDRIVFIRQGALVAQRLDIARGALIGDPVTVVKSIAADAAEFRSGFSTSASGILAYRTGTGAAMTTRWVDRHGKELMQLPEYFNGPELSPDETQVAGDRTQPGNRDVWIGDLVRGGGSTRVTTDAFVDGYPVWSPDGTALAYESTRLGTFDIWTRPINGPIAETTLVGTSDEEWPLQWSKNGFLLYQQTDEKRRWDLWALPMTGDNRKPIPVANTSAAERMGQFSPDGHWVIYETNESGRREIVAQAFPEPTLTYPVSTAGGIAPRWHPNGSEVYFVAPDGMMMAVPIRITGQTLKAGPAVPLFAIQLAIQAFDVQYAVSRDGRFLVTSAASEALEATPIDVILNWAP